MITKKYVNFSKSKITTLAESYEDIQIKFCRESKLNPFFEPEHKILYLIYANGSYQDSSFFMTRSMQSTFTVYFIQEKNSSFHMIV